jgi:rod shape determining protein RodA
MAVDERAAVTIRPENSRLSRVRLWKPRLRGGIGDPPLMALAMLTSAFGILMVYSAGQVEVATPVRGLWRMQLLWFGVALLLLPVVLYIPVTWVRRGTVPLYALAVTLLALTPLIGSGYGTAEGVPRWIGLGPVRIQTSEFVKIPLILMLARILSRWRQPPRTLWELWKPTALTVVPIGLVMMQPDIGSAIVLLLILVATLFWAGVPMALLALLATPAIGLVTAFVPWVYAGFMLLLIAVLIFHRLPLKQKSLILAANLVVGAIAVPAWESLAEYQQNRLLVFMDPYVDPQGAGYQVIQSQIAIGSGQILGQGFQQGPQKQLAFLPEQHTDFIFAVIGEELGFLGASSLLIVFAIIFWRLVRIAERLQDPFLGIFVFGVFGAWFTHVLINVGMTLGVMPVTGIPLPFISYGGSFLLVSLLAMGLVQRAAAESRT